MPVVSTTAGAHDEPRAWGPLGAAALAAALFCGGLLLAHTGEIGILRALGPFGLFLAVVSPSPLVVQRLRGTLPAVVAVLASALLVGAALSLGMAFLFALTAGPVLLIGDAMARGRGLRRGCVWAAAVITAELLLLLLVSGPQIGALMTKWIPALWSPEYLAELRQWGMPADRVEQWVQDWKLWESALTVVYPAAFLIMGMLVVIANAVVVRTYLARRDPAWLDGNEFEGIRLPFGLAVVFVLAGATVVFPPVRPVGYNVLLLVAFLLAIQGVAVVLYYAHRLAGPPFLRVLVVMLVLFNPWSRELLPALGLFDLWFDFRKYADIPEPPK